VRAWQHLLTLGRYAQQIVNFLSFVSELLSFPFNDWPSGN